MKLKYSNIKLVYIVGPYRGETPERTLQNIQAARHVGSLVCEAGHYPVIPHSNTANFEHLGLKSGDGYISDSFWLAATLELMTRCDALMLIEGWENSFGSKNEIAKAQEMMIPIYSSIIDLKEGLSNG